MTVMTYIDRLFALRVATSTALSDAQHTMRCAAAACANDEGAAKQAYGELWEDLLGALADNADCDQADLGIVAGTLDRSVPIVGTVSGPDARVSWNSDRAGRCRKFSGFVESERE